MRQSSTHHLFNSTQAPALTLIELLVVISIISLPFTVSSYYVAP